MTSKMGTEEMDQKILIPTTDIEISQDIIDIGLAFTAVIIIMFLIKLVFRGFGSRAKPSTESHIGVDLQKGQLAIDYLQRLISEKYNYYMYLDLLPIYLDRKIPEKNIIKDVKEKIYVSVVGSLTKPVKQEILKFFTEKGIEIFVHESIVIHMNKTDFQASDSVNSRFISDLRDADIDKIL